MIVPEQAQTELADILQPDERVIWAARPDARSTLRTKMIVWIVAVPFCAAVFGLFMSGKVSAAILYPLALVGIALLATPFVMLFDNALTTYAITNRRALIARKSPSRPPLVSCGFDAMDDELEILETGGGAGHLYFASGWSAKQRDVDHTGKLAFRDVGNVHAVAAILDRVRRGR